MGAIIGGFVRKFVHVRRFTAAIRQFITMKTLLLASALPLLSTLATSQENPPAPPAETVKKARLAAWLGIMMEETDGRVKVAGAAKHSPAGKAGLQTGDVLLALDGKALAGTMRAIADEISRRQPGDTVELRIRRGDKEEALKVTLGERPESNEEFRGEFHRPEELRQNLDEAKKASEKTLKQAKKQERKLEKQLKERTEREDDEDEKDDDEDDKEKLKAGKEKQKSDDKAAKENALKNLRKLYGAKPDADDPDGMLRFYLDRPWPGDADLPKLRMQWQRQGGMFDPRRGFYPPRPGARASVDESKIWEHVEKAVGLALKESGLAPEVVEKAMQAVAQARKHSPHREADRSRLKAEAAKLEKEMEALKGRMEKLHRQLKAQD